MSGRYFSVRSNLRQRKAMVGLFVLMLSPFWGGAYAAAEDVPSTPAPESRAAFQTEQVKDPTKLAIRMMEEVEKRQKELSAREEALRQKETVLKSLESELQETLKALERKQEELMALEKRLNEQEEDRLDQLAKIFEAAPPEQGGRLLSELEPKTAARLLSRMNSRKAGRLWAYVDPTKAAVISEILTKQHKK
jgi:flagellar motility protein MotE (MotC chaperone)